MKEKISLILSPYELAILRTDSFAARMKKNLVKVEKFRKIKNESYWCTFEILPADFSGFCTDLKYCVSIGMIRQNNHIVQEAAKEDRKYGRKRGA